MEIPRVHYLNLSEPENVTRYEDITVRLSDIIHSCDIDFHKYEFDTIYEYTYYNPITDKIIGFHNEIESESLFTEYFNLKVENIYGVSSNTYISELSLINPGQDGHIIYFFPKKEVIFVVSTPKSNLVNNEYK